MANCIKKIDKDKYYEALDMFLHQGMTTVKCAEHVGLSARTLVKYFNTSLRGEPLPKGLFFEDEDKK